MFAAVGRQFQDAKVQNWIKEEEKALHFGLAAFLPGGAGIVEIGSFEGASTIFSAAGVSRRGEGSVTAIDPHFGAPPWLGTGPQQWTLGKFQQNIERFGLSKWVRPRIGDSAAVAAVWDTTPIDLVFIDGDHSYLGVLRDFECFAPKLRPWGLILIDDADDPCVPGVLELVEQLRALPSVANLGMVGGIAVFQRLPGDGWEMLSGLGARRGTRGIHRPWDMSYLHTLRLPSNYLRSATWKCLHTTEAYHLAFLARCPGGAYGLTPASTLEDREIVHAVSRDRQDGPVVALSEGAGNCLCRAIFGSAPEAARFAPCLVPGGVYLSRRSPVGDNDNPLHDLQLLEGAALQGAGWNEVFHWGFWRPQHISADALIDYALKAYQEPGRVGE